jgi:hypothetical protein
VGHSLGQWAARWVDTRRIEPGAAERQPAESGFGERNPAVYREPVRSTPMLAMQKVEGSNPFSRFARRPRSGRAFLCEMEGPRLRALETADRVSRTVEGPIRTLRRYKTIFCGQPKVRPNAFSRCLTRRPKQQTHPRAALPTSGSGPIQPWKIQRSRPGTECFAPELAIFPRRRRYAACSDCLPTSSATERLSRLR